MTAYYSGEYNGGELVGVIVTFTVITGLLVIWRIAFRFTRTTLNLSDYCIIISLMLALAQAAFNATATTKYGYGYHKIDLPPEIRTSKVPSILFWLNQWFFKLQTGFTKISIILIYAKIFNKADSKTIHISRILNFFLGFTVVAYYFAGSIVSIFQCTPVNKVWQKKLPGKCIDNDEFRMANAFINVITSAWIIILPLPTLIQLQARGNELTQLMGLILLGTVHTSCAISRLILLFYPAKDASTDPQWASTTGNTVAMVEEFVGIIAATLIVMRPCLHSLGKAIGWSTTTHSTSGGHSKISGLSYGMDTIHSRSQGFNKIMRTTEVTLENRSVSTEHILSQKSVYSG